MKRLSLSTLLTGVIGAAASVSLAADTVSAWPASGPQATQLAFVAGPLLFLSVLAWGRRNRPGRSLFLFRETIVLACGGVAFLGIVWFRFRREPPNWLAWQSHPLLVPIVQWAVAMGTWLFLVIREGQEEREAKKNA
jgi:hypothetical protein